MIKLQLQETNPVSMANPPPYHGRAFQLWGHAKQIFAISRIFTTPSGSCIGGQNAKKFLCGPTLPHGMRQAKAGFAGPTALRVALSTGTVPRFGRMSLRMRGFRNFVAHTALPHGMFDVCLADNNTSPLKLPILI
ncbi:MAG: hypothetical protein ACOCWJ_03090 [Verrucomicrobiota bacterium]